MNKTERKRESLLEFSRFIVFYFLNCRVYSVAEIHINRMGVVLIDARPVIAFIDSIIDKNRKDNSIEISI